MEITFWGTRGSIASPGPDTVVHGGNTTCLEVTLGSGHTVVIDAGTGIRRVGDHLMSRKEPLDIHLLITHIHWDHILGFPFFAPIFDGNSRIMVDGFVKSLEGLKHVFSNTYLDGTWPLRFEDLKAHIEPRRKMGRGESMIGDALVEPHRLQHPQGGLGLKFTEKTGVFVFLTDNELVDDGWKGACFKDFVAFCKGADLVVHDCQYLPEEIHARRGWGHSDLNSVTKLAMEAEVKKLVLFHHDPWRDDEEVSAMAQRARDIFAAAGAPIEIEAAREGMTLRV